MQKTWKPALQIAFTYIGTVVGAGFASGRELLEFFVQYGAQGLVGILLSLLLFIWAGTRIMVVAHRIGARTFEEFNQYLFGQIGGTLFHVLLFLVLLGTTSVMLAATGALFMESFALSRQAGIWLSILLIVVVAYRGLGAIHAINSLFVPLLIGFTCLVLFHVQPWQESSVTSVVVESVKPFAWLSSPLYYVAMNAALAQAVLVPIGQESPSEKPLIVGGLLGGFGIGILLICGYFSLHGQMAHIAEAEMPMIALIADMGRWFPLFFALLVYVEILSTLSANVYGLARQLAIPRLLSVLLIVSFCYGVSFFGFSSLLRILYPLFGQLVLVFLVMLAVRHWQQYKRTSL